MRRLSLLVIGVFCISILFGTQVQAQTVWKMAFVAPPPVWGPVAEKYGQIVAQKTNNQFQIKWFGGRTVRQSSSDHCRDQDRTG